MSITGDFSLKINKEPVPEALNYGNSYKMWNDGSVECEVGELLYGLVRILKPKNILETGTYKGFSAAYMATGLRDNGFGFLTTIEYNKVMIQKAEKLWIELGLTNFIQQVQGYSLNFDTGTKFYELLFLDTEPEYRFKELVKFYPNLSPGGYALIHDLSRDMSQHTHNQDHKEVDPWPFGPISQEMQNWLKDGDLVKFHFPNPRGLTGFYKTHSGDYKLDNYVLFDGM